MSNIDGGRRTSGPTVEVPAISIQKSPNAPNRLPVALLHAGDLSDFLADLQP